jgi:hypothetical protein
MEGEGGKRPCGYLTTAKEQYQQDNADRFNKDDQTVVLVIDNHGW